MTDALVAFVKARLNDDELTALAASTGPWRSHTGPEMKWLSKGELIHPVWTWDRVTGTPMIMTAMWADSQHIAWWSPARTLREVEAKRGLLDAALADRHHVSADQYETCPRATAADGLDSNTAAALDDLNEERRQEDGVEPKCWDSCGRDARVRRTLELLALPYSDHPGYEEALRP